MEAVRRLALICLRNGDRQELLKGNVIKSPSLRLFHPTLVFPASPPPSISSSFTVPPLSPVFASSNLFILHAKSSPPPHPLLFFTPRGPFISVNQSNAIPFLLQSLPPPREGWPFAINPVHVFLTLPPPPLRLHNRPN